MIEIFKLDAGYGYRVGGVYQEYNPTLEGFVPMTKQEEETFAAEVKARLEE